jgi:hypothetical protein
MKNTSERMEQTGMALQAYKYRPSDRHRRYRKTKKGVEGEVTTL